MTRQVEEVRPVVLYPQSKRIDEFIATYFKHWIIGESRQKCHTNNTLLPPKYETMSTLHYGRVDKFHHKIDAFDDCTVLPKFNLVNYREPNENSFMWELSEIYPHTMNELIMIYLLALRYSDHYDEHPEWPYILRESLTAENFTVVIRAYITIKNLNRDDVYDTKNLSDETIIFLLQQDMKNAVGTVVIDLLDEDVLETVSEKRVNFSQTRKIEYRVQDGCMYYCDNTLHEL